MLIDCSEPHARAEDVLKVCLQPNWNALKQKSFNEAALNVIKRLRASVAAGGGHFEHIL